MPNNLPASNWLDAERIDLFGGLKVYSGPALTRGLVRSFLGDEPSVGSLYVGAGMAETTKPNLYVKVKNDGADSDWERVVTAATD